MITATAPKAIGASGRAGGARRAAADGDQPAMVGWTGQPFLNTNRSFSLAPTHPRHDDIIIYRRFREHASTHVVKQIYAVTYPGHTDRDAEHENYGKAEEVALGLAEGQERSVWYEETPQSGRRTLVRSFRASD